MLDQLQLGEATNQLLLVGAPTVRSKLGTLKPGHSSPLGRATPETFGQWLLLTANSL